MQKKRQLVVLGTIQNTGLQCGVHIAEAHGRSGAAQQSPTNVEMMRLLGRSCEKGNGTDRSLPGRTADGRQLC